MGIEDFSKKQEKLSDNDLIKKINENLESVKRNRKQTEEIPVKIPDSELIKKINENLESVKRNRKPSKETENRDKKELVQVNIDKKPKTNKKESLGRWKKVLYTGGLGLVVALSAGGLIQKSNGSPEKIKPKIENDNEVIGKIENFNQISNYVDTSYYRNLEKERNYTAELNYLKRADSLEKGKIIGKNLVISENKTGNGYAAYFIDNENRVIDSITNIPGTSTDYEIRNIGGDIVIKDDETITNVEKVLGTTFPEKIKSFLKPIGTRKQKEKDGGVIEYIYSNITVTPKKEHIDGKVAIIGNIIDGDFLASPIRFVSERKFRKELKNIIKKRMPSDFTLIKQAFLGNESTDTKKLNYELKCSIGHACGPYQIIPYWHFFRTLLDYTSEKDLDFFIKHPSVQDMTFRLYIKALTDKHGDDIKSIAADYFHGDEGVNAFNQGEGYSVTDGFGTNVDKYVGTFIESFESAVWEARKELHKESHNEKEEDQDNEKDKGEEIFVQK